MSAKKRVVIGTRGSKLALTQTEFVAAKLKEIAPQTEIIIEKINTKGDKILDVPLAKIGGKGLFTKELENAMLRGETDMAIHSLKDMPTETAAGLSIVALTARIEARDAFIGRCTFAELPQGATVGTSSLRRRAQLLKIRPDLNIVDLRGNVNTRLKKFAEGEFDGIILAAAGLIRLNLQDKITEYLPAEKILPAAGQGILAIEARADDEETKALAAYLNDETAALCAEAERGFLAEVGGGCQVPVGALATIDGDFLHLDAMIAAIDGKSVYRDKATCRKTDAELCGRKLAKELISRGGNAVLRELGLT